MENTKLAQSQLLWSSRVDTFKTSGLSQAEYCKVHNYKVKQFNYWFRKLKKITIPAQSEKLQWISVNVTEPVINDFLTVRIGTAAVEVKLGFNKHLLSDIVQALSKL